MTTNIKALAVHNPLVLVLYNQALFIQCLRAERDLARKDSVRIEAVTNGDWGIFESRGGFTVHSKEMDTLGTGDDLRTAIDRAIEATKEVEK